MCTVTIVPYDAGVRLGCNRDERHDRPAALAPRVRRTGDVLALFPTDLTGGGTWIGVNERGLAAALLNRTVAGDRPAVGWARCSRGAIVAQLLGAQDLDHALTRVIALPVRAFDPFTLLALQADTLVVVTSDGHEYAVSTQVVDRPICFSSSSLGDTLVIERRLELFERTLSRFDDPLHAQAVFHWHHWPAERHLSVQMQRADAATVSRTVLTIEETRASMRYHPLGGGVTRVDLPLERRLRCTSWPASSSRPS